MEKIYKINKNNIRKSGFFASFITKRDATGR
jgi:hypothetical protein